MKKKNWKVLVKQLDAGTLCTNDWFYKWFHGCWKKYSTAQKTEELELWWTGVIKYFDKTINSDVIKGSTGTNKKKK